jgi:hypothetical protein
MLGNLLMLKSDSKNIGEAVTTILSRVLGVVHSLEEENDQQIQDEIWNVSKNGNFNITEVVPEFLANANATATTSDLMIKMYRTVFVRTSLVNAFRDPDLVMNSLYIKSKNRI